MAINNKQYRYKTVDKIIIFIYFRNKCKDKSMSISTLCLHTRSMFIFAATSVAKFIGDEVKFIADIIMTLLIFPTVFMWIKDKAVTFWY